MKLSHHTYLDLGKTIFLFFVAVTTAVAVPTPGSYRCGGASSGEGRATETSAMEDPKLGDTEAS
jgi:hypothetical protein